MQKEDLENSEFQKYIVEEIFVNYKNINNNDDIRNKFYKLTNKNLINLDKSLNLQIFRKDFLSQDNIKSNFFILRSNEMINTLKNDKEEYFQYFNDATFLIILNKHNFFKLLVILAYNIKYKKTKISTLEFYQIMEEYTFIKFFSRIKFYF